MEEINYNIKGIQVTDQPNGTHHLILIAVNDAHASAIYLGLGNEVIIGYSNADGLMHIQFELIDTQKFFRLQIIDKAKAVLWMDYIDAKTITDLWVGYHDKNGQICPYGLSTRLRT